MKPSSRLLNQIYTTDSLLNLWSTCGGQWGLFEQECLVEIHHAKSRAGLPSKHKTDLLEVALALILLGLVLWVGTSIPAQPSTMPMDKAQVAQSFTEGR